MAQGRDSRLGLRVWLFVLTLTALLPLLGFCFYTIVQVDRHQQRIVLAELTQQSQNSLRAVEMRLRSAVSTLTALAESDAVRNEDWLGLYTQAQRVLERNPEFRAMTLADQHNRLIFHTSLPFGAPDFAASAQDALRQALNSGRVRLSGPFVAPISPVSVVAVSMPLLRQGQTHHALRMILLTDSLGELLDSQGLPKGWWASLVDPRGMVLARSHAGPGFVGQPLPQVHLDALKRQETGLYAGLSSQGQPSTYLLQPVFEGQWHLVLGVLDDALLVPVQSTWSHLLMLALLTIGLSFLLSQWMARSLVAQATRLVQVARTAQPGAVQEGHFRVREFDALMQGLLDSRVEQAATQGYLNHVLDERDAVRDLYELAPCGYHSLDRQGCVMRVNQTELGWLGRTRADVVGRPFTDFLTPDSQRVFAENFPNFLARGEIHDLELALVRPDGSVLPVMLSATAVKDAQGRFLMSRTSLFDLTERKKLEARLDHMARTDVLTELSNRLDFYDHAEQEMSRARRFQLPLAVLMIDIDHFKQINDRHGHAAGDEVLRALARICRETVREIDLVARIGGEEFAVLLPQTPLEPAMEVADRLRLRLSSVPVYLKTAELLHMTVSIGVTTLQAQDQGVDDLLKRADQASYAAKHEGRDRVRVQA